MWPVLCLICCETEADLFECEILCSGSLMLQHLVPAALRGCETFRRYSFSEESGSLEQAWGLIARSHLLSLLPVPLRCKQVGGPALLCGCRLLWSSLLPPPPTMMARLPLNHKLKAVLPQVALWIRVKRAASTLASPLPSANSSVRVQNPSWVDPSCPPWRTANILPGRYI